MGEHHTDTVYPQIARISFADGDVRIERGGDKHRKDVTWEAASANVPLEAGYSLVTGDGRAEIELEDASTLYVAPSSFQMVSGSRAKLSFCERRRTTSSPTIRRWPSSA